MLKRLVLISALALVSVLGSLTLDTPRVAQASADCIAANRSFFGIGVYGYTQSSVQTVSVDANELLTFSITTVSGSGVHWLVVDGAIVSGPVPWAGTLSYIFPSSDTYVWQHHVSGSGVVDIFWGCGLATGGRDMVPLPETAVVGAFTQTTPAYFEPRSDAASDVIFEVGKTAWVLGLDASGQFYQIVFSGDYLWVPVNTMGPNFDDVWNGTPLPTVVVE